MANHSMSSEAAYLFANNALDELGFLTFSI